MNLTLASNMTMIGAVAQLGIPFEVSVIDVPVPRLHLDFSTAQI